jgi:hypothetical protein
MPREVDDRSERLSQLQALVDDEKREFPQLDPDALNTAMADLAEQERRGSRLRQAGWWLIALIALGVVIALVVGLR